MKAPSKVISALFYLLISQQALANQSITIQNDTDVIISGSYKADIINKNQQTQVVQDTFPIPPGAVVTPPLPYNLIRQRYVFTTFFGDCPSSVVFHVEYTGAFTILEPNALGPICEHEGVRMRLVGSIAPNTFNILLQEHDVPGGVRY